MRTLLILFASLCCASAQNYANQFKNTLPATNAWVAYSLPGGKLYDLTIYNVSASLLYVHVFDSNVVPSDGAFPTLAPQPLPANSSISYSYTGGRGFTNGITICTSTTPITLTNGTASFKIDISYGGSQ